jgi:plasmid stabilization system protein ParE
VLAVRWADEAVVDLAEIIGYIEVRDPLAAQRLLDDILQTIEQLPLMPSLFRSGRVEGTREIVVRPNYLVVYKVGSDTMYCAYCTPDESIRSVCRRLDRDSEEPHRRRDVRAPFSQPPGTQTTGR